MNTPATGSWRSALGGAGTRLPHLSVLEVGPGAGAEAYAPLPADRFRALAAGSDWVSEVAARTTSGPVFAVAAGPVLFGENYPRLARTLLQPRREAKLVGVPTPPTDDPWVPDDLGAIRSVAGVAVAVPADAAAAHAAVLALVDLAGPGYLRLPPESAPSVTGGVFEFGRARELRSGADLTVVALGRAVAGALDVAEALSRIGISVRVLDAASVQPFDEAAILRAARETGALLVLEPGPLSTGVGALVASLTAENSPVPVRRLRWGGPPGPPADGDAGMERARDEAWELLRLRGRAP